MVDFFGCSISEIFGDEVLENQESKVFDRPDHIGKWKENKSFLEP